MIKKVAKKLVLTAVVGALTGLAAMVWSDHLLNQPQPSV
jgi:hypothetical protein